MITVDFQCLHLPAGSRILDIGCGSGRHVAAAYDLERVEVIGADPCFSDLKKAQARLQFHDYLGAHGRGRWRLHAADIKHLPFADAGFDLVICSEVLEHIPNDLSAMQEIVRVLKPGGQLVVSVPRCWPETICWMLSRQYRHDPGGHVRIYNARQLLNRIESLGVTHWRTHFAHGLHSPYWWLKCFLGVHRKEPLWPVRIYHQFLVWDLMEQPRITRIIEQLLNPILGKSVVLYFRKPGIGE
ncbi:MAG: methyltransferase domain-containing protein [Desulfobacteraceae bacterium]|nr:methyltransferase domain-containing protein [Desulfobacteraceae bacterium]